MVNIDSLIQNECKLWFHGDSSSSFLIKPDGVTITPNGTFNINVLKDNSKCLVYDGSTNYIILSANSAWSFGISDFTVCLWFKSNTTTQWHTIIGNTIDPGSVGVSTSWRLGINHGNTSGYISLTKGSAALYSHTTPVNDNKWHFVVLKSTSRIATLYIDLMPPAITYDMTTIPLNFTDVNTLTFMACNFSPGGIGDITPGSIRHPMIFKKALTMDQIGAIMEATYIQ